jgi:hypothetical protein
MLTYSHEIEETMKKFYETLSEKDKRGYAAIEAGIRWGTEGKNISVKCTPQIPAPSSAERKNYKTGQKFQKRG